jgi:hypothetical protein
MKDEDQKSISASTASSTTSTSTNIAVIRFNAFDEILFALFWIIYKEKKLPIQYWFLCLLWTVISSLGVTFYFHNWPMWGWLGKIIYDFFLFVILLFFKRFINFVRWTTFTISWGSNTFLKVLFIIVAVVVLFYIIGVVIVTILSKKEKRVYNAIGKSVSTACILATTLFCYAFNNVFFGHFLCLIPEEKNPEDISYSVLTIDCNDSTILIMIILTSVVALIYITPTIFLRLFIFNFDLKEKDYSTTQSGFFSAFSYVLITILQLTAIFLRQFPYVSSIIGLGFGILICYCFFFFFFFSYYLV